MSRAICIAKNVFTQTLVCSPICRARNGLAVKIHPVTQLSDIKRQKVKLEALKRETEEERQKAKEAARERVLLEFEKGQLGLAAAIPLATTSGLDSKEREYMPHYPKRGPKTLE